jgi:hypothetical protein
MPPAAGRLAPKIGSGGRFFFEIFLFFLYGHPFLHTRHSDTESRLPLISATRGTRLAFKSLRQPPTRQSGIASTPSAPRACTRHASQAWARQLGLAPCHIALGPFFISHQAALALSSQAPSRPLHPSLPLSLGMPTRDGIPPKYLKSTHLRTDPVFS